MSLDRSTPLSGADQRPSSGREHHGRAVAVAEDLFDKITVTKPSLPDFDEFMASMRQVWDSRYLTNMGPFHERFEAALCEYLGVPFISLFCNGTMALQTGLQALRITGEVITTPFTFPATAHAIYWNRCTPVFCDIEPDSLSIDPERIESLITPETTAILPCHVYGKPSDTRAIQEVADLHGLRVLYDAAHAFGVFPARGADDSVWGDMSMLSFHATKVFNSIEGGALVMRTEKMKKRVDYLKNFGIADEVTIVGQGVNGKMNEICAAFGLLQLDRLERDIALRGALDARYREHLGGVPGLRMLEHPPGYNRNYCYFPIFIGPEFGPSRDAVYERLAARDIYSRRYFYPLVSQAPCYRHLPSARLDRLPVAARMAEEVLCLPLYPTLEPAQVDMICEIILEGRGR